jgi:polygalacturonase
MLRSIPPCAGVSPVKFQPVKFHHARFYFAAAAFFVLRAGFAAADPVLPTFNSTVYDISVSNPAINGGVAASINSSDNSAAINAYIAYCSSHGGGTVEIPSGTFLSSEITMQSNVNLQIDAAGVLQDTNPASTLITTSGATSNIEISGAGAINGAATTATSSADLVILKNASVVAVTGVTIENASHEHLVTESDHNVTINGITIADAGTLAANGGNYLANTDGIDFSGTNFLIENSKISDGDDNIVAKPASTATSNVTITNNTIGAGHGISIGGGSAAGLTNMVVSNTTFNGTQNGVRIKAEDAAGGDAGGGTAHPVDGVTYTNLTMTNVANPIIIDSFYNGDNNYPTSPTDPTHYPAAAGSQDSTTPVFEDISFNDITALGASNGGLIYGLNTSPQSVDGITFTNVNITANSHMDLWYATEVTLDGLTVNVPSGDLYADSSPVDGVYFYNVTFAGSIGAVPLPPSALEALPMLAVLGGIYLLRRCKSGWIF